MSRVTFSPAALSDIDGIWDYTAETWGLDQADHYTDDIRDTCDALAAGLKQGRAVDVRDGYLKYAVGKHFYSLCGLVTGSLSFAFFISRWMLVYTCSRILG